MKKKILIIIPSMFLGGAERSLLGLLEAIDYTQNEVSLFVYRHEGELMEYIPKQVNLLPEINKYRTVDVPIISLLKSKNFIFGIARLVSKISLKFHCLFSHETYGIWMSRQYTERYIQPFLPKISGKYDAALMFLGVADVLHGKVDAKLKLAWVHTDFASLYPSKKMDFQTYSHVDKIIHVSDNCLEKMAAAYPELADKMLVIENILSKSFIESQSAEHSVTDFTAPINLLSIGRFSEAKNFDNVPDICKRIRQTGLDVKWYLIGYGGDEALIRQKIKEAGMEDYVIILGKKTNPYPYIKACDLYVQPSRYEGKSVTVREAQILHKPVVITNYATSASQLENGVDGVVVPMDNAACARGIADLLNNPAKMHELSENTKLRDYTNANEVEKIYRLMKTDHVEKRD